MISISNISKKFNNSVALDNISFNIPSDSITAIVGANGAGKTTLLKILVKLLDADSGQINYENVTSIKEFRSKIGYLPEQRGLYTDVDIKTQLMHFASIRGISKKEALQNVSYWLKKFGVNHLEHMKINTLSKGMQQKIQLISSLVNMPSLLFMDEPLSGLDPLNFRYFCSLIKEYQLEYNTTIVLSTHNMTSVEHLCSSVAILNKAKLQDFGSITDIKKKYSTNGRYYFNVKKSNLLIFNRSNILNPSFSYKIIDIDPEIAKIEVVSLKKDSSLLNALEYLKNIFSHIDIISCAESIPSMEDIFVEINQ